MARIVLVALAVVEACLRQTSAFQPSVRLQRQSAPNLVLKRPAALVMNAGMDGSFARARRTTTKLGGVLTSILLPGIAAAAASTASADPHLGERVATALRCVQQPVPASADDVSGHLDFLML